jgi:hypothetical protein
MDKIQINVVRYAMQANDPAYKALRKTLAARGLREMQVWHDGKGGPPEGVHHVETQHLFDNQSNTKEGFRVFDWYDGLSPNCSFRTGHYIADDAGFAALQELRRNTNRCAYCGHQEAAARGLVFHLDCLGSEYLERKDLHMIRMVCVADGFNAALPELTEAETAHLLPQYKEAQLHGNNARSKARIAKKRADLKAKFEKETENAKAEFEGFTWLMDHGVNIDNVIYYSHTGRFCFGWRKPIDSALYSELCEILCEFCFDYDIKRTEERAAS